MFYAPQSETKDGGAFASRRKDAPPSDKGQKIHIFSMHRTNGFDPLPVTPFVREGAGGSFHLLTYWHISAILCIRKVCSMTIENKIEKRQKVYTVEFWRFAFTVLVALYHLEIFYQRKLMPSGTTAVEFFFILAGFTIAMSASERRLNNGAGDLTTREARIVALDYVKKKLAVIYPLLAITLILAIVVIPLVTPQMFAFPPAQGAGLWSRILENLGILINSEWEWLIMVGTPMGFNNATASSAPIVPLWFLTQLLIVGYLYAFLVNRKYDLMMFAAPLIAVLGYTYFALNSENVLDFYIKMGLFNAGTVRAISEMAMGIALFQLYAHMKNRDWKLMGKIMLQLLELFAIYRYCALTWGAGISIDNFRRIPYILIIILLSFVNITLLSKLLNRKIMEKLGKISLPMFLIHFPLATLYVSMMLSLKRRPFASSLPGFIQNSAGTNRSLRPIGLSPGDLLMYLPLIIIVSILMQLLITAIRRLKKKNTG